MPAHSLPAEHDGIAVLGDDLLGVSVADPATAQQLAATLRDTGDWLDVVAGIDSVAVHVDLVVQDLHTAREQLHAELEASPPADTGVARLVEIPVCYGGEYGPDFEAVCARLDLSAAQLIELHTALECTVDMLGFTPGFAYIGGLPADLNVPRLEQPRLHVAAGSIGIADGRAGIYALGGPGGWPLIGRTPMALFDADAAEPFVLRAGARVRFRAIDAEQFLAMAGS